MHGPAGTHASVTANTNVVIVGTGSMAITAALPIAVPVTSTLHVYVAGAFTMATGTSLNASGYAGALRIYTSTATNCTVANNCRLAAMFHAPNARFSASGSSAANRLSGYFNAKAITVSGTQNLHYDESLPVHATYEMTRYLVCQSAADRATVSGLTGGYLR